MLVDDTNCSMGGCIATIACADLIVILNIILAKCPACSLLMISQGIKFEGLIGLGLGKSLFPVISTAKDQDFLPDLFN